MALRQPDESEQAATTESPSPLAEKRENERRLASEAKQGCRRALGELIKSTEPGLRGFIAARVDAQDQEDVFGATWVAVIEVFNRFDEARYFFPWLCGVADNVSRDWLRRKSRAGQPLSSLGGDDRTSMFVADILAVDSFVLGVELLDERHKQEAKLWEALQTLTEEQRRILIMRYSTTPRPSYREIAEVICKSANAIRKQHNCAIRKLRELLSGQYE